MFIPPVYGMNHLLVPMSILSYMIQNNTDVMLLTHQKWKDNVKKVHIYLQCNDSFIDNEAAAI